MIVGGFAVLHVSNVESAVRFYIETLGMKLVEQTDKSALIDTGDGFRISLETGNSHGHVVLHPKLSISEVKAIFENRGVVFEGNRFHDSDGNVLELR